MSAEPLVADNVLEISTSEGTGDFLLSGSPNARLRPWRDAFGDGAQVYYAIQQDGEGFEVGLGTLSYGNPDRIQREEIFSSSKGVKVDFPPGKKVVFSTIPSEKIAPAGGPGRLWSVDAETSDPFEAEVFMLSLNFNSNRILVGEGGTGAFSGHDHELAESDDSGQTWTFRTGSDGDLVYSANEKAWFVLTRDGSDGFPADGRALVSPPTPSLQSTTSNITVEHDPDSPIRTVYVNNASDRSVTLPNPSATDFKYVVVNIGAGNVTVDVQSSGTINGSSSHGPLSQHQSATFAQKSNGEYYVVATS